MPASATEDAIPGHDVSTVPEMGWAGLPDREILELAAARVDVFVPVDRTLWRHRGREQRLGLIVLTTPSNRLSELLPLVPVIRAALETIRAGQIVRL